MIYLDSAATSFYRPSCVAEAVAEAIASGGNSARGTHPAALAASRVVYETRSLLNELFHGDGAEQVAFTANSTESLNIALKGLISPGDVVVSTDLEHNSVLRPLYELEERGVTVQFAGCLGADQSPDDPLRRRGLLDYDALERLIRPGVRAVVCTHASNLTGNVVDIRRIGARCREIGALFLVDASQTAGLLPIDMEKDGIDVLCFTGHKGLMGPQGTGGLCVRSGCTIRPLLSGGSGIETFSRRHPQIMPTALEAGTLNSHGIAGLRAALLYLMEQGTEALWKRERELADLFLQQVSKIEGIKIYGDVKAEKRAAIVTLNLGEEDSGMVSDYLAAECGIATRSGGHCAPRMHEALGTREQGAVRFSFSHFNTEEDVIQAAKALAEY